MICIGRFGEYDLYVSADGAITGKKYEEPLRERWIVIFSDGAEELYKTKEETQKYIGCGRRIERVKFIEATEEKEHEVFIGPEQEFRIGEDGIKMGGTRKRRTPLRQGCNK